MAQSLLALVSELTERQCGRVFAYRDYVALLHGGLDDDRAGTS